MKNIILLGSIVCMMTAYSQGSDENMDTSVRPQDDLYNYVNGSWMVHTEIPADKSRWGAYEELVETMQKVPKSKKSKICISRY
jgi:putative endopeptidase